MVDADQHSRQRLALYEADDETVMTALTSTGIPADRKELEGLMVEQDSAALVVDALCEKHSVELDDDAFGIAEWTVALLHDRWLDEENP